MIVGGVFSKQYVAPRGNPPKILKLHCRHSDLNANKHSPHPRRADEHVCIQQEAGQTWEWALLVGNTAVVEKKVRAGKLKQREHILVC